MRVSIDYTELFCQKSSRLTIQISPVQIFRGIEMEHWAKIG